MEKFAPSKEKRMLVLLAQSGEKEAMGKLISMLQPPLFRYLLRLLEKHSMAEDILQDVLLIIYRKLFWLDDPDLIMPWAYRIASRAAFKELKKEKHSIEVLHESGELDEVQQDQGSVSFSPGLFEISGMLDKVPPASRAVLILHYLEDMTLREVAEILGINPGTAKSRLNYGLETLRRHFGR